MIAGPYLSTVDLPTMLLNRDAERQRGAFSIEDVAKTNGAEHDGEIVPLDELEKRAIIKALQYTKGDRTLASHALGIGRTTLYRKLKKYGM